MRTLRKNHQKMLYANFVSNVDVYERDSEGNIIYTEINGRLYPLSSGHISRYETPIEFKANISMNSGETRLAEYGLDEGDYNAVICAEKGTLPFSEQTLIWHTSEPEYDGLGYIKAESADYKVVAVRTSLNEERFLLKKRVDD